MPLTDMSEHQSLNLCGLRCSHLVISVIQVFESIQIGKVLRVRATVLNAPPSSASWVRQHDNELIAMYQEGECFVFLLKRIPWEIAGFRKRLATSRQKEESRKLTADR